MKRLVLIALFFSLLIYGQANKKKLIGKVFITKLESICEEVSPPDPCAGYEEYMILAFKENDVLVTEKQITSCDKETVSSQRKFTWKIKESEIIIKIPFKEKQNTVLKNFSLKLEKEGIIGIKKTYENKTVHYKFEEIKRK